ncbi:ABC transporter permease [Nocardioides carbamazepini]|jgi:peptide/nickel transport system permease protein|uniref:ABC transporter permease n=1 Tax=Nocardioides carbamazepini TaxID=2854259 RepID=UPI002149FC5B|nr:ABC transporter permease [Nocardioides carbamazepini]MCR1785699.1 ABC transporter permease [Nocardioides carbamazepini]
MTTVATTHAVPRVRRTRRRLPWLDRIAYGTVVLLLGLAILGPLLTPHDPYAVDLGQALQAPSGGHLLGTDGLGRDVLSRALAGARSSILGALLAVAGAAAIGILVACVATIGGRWVDDVVMRFCDITLSLPVMVMALGVAVALGPSLRSAVIAMVVAWWPGFARIARAEMRTVITSPYVEAARVLGASRWRVMLRHVLPNSLDGVYVQATLEIGGATLIMAGLSFVGAGAQPPSAEWGAMVETGARYLTSAWWISVVPGLLITLTALAFAISGDSLRTRNHPDAALT